VKYYVYFYIFYIYIYIYFLYFIFLISRQYDLVDAKRLATKPSPKSFLKLTIEAGFITF